MLIVDFGMGDIAETHNGDCGYYIWEVRYVNQEKKEIVELQKDSVLCCAKMHL